MKNEGTTTSIVEDKTRKIPTISFLGLAFASMGVSLALLLAGRKNLANFVGQWVPSILIMGTYNKIAKTFSPPYSETQRRKHGDNASVDHLRPDLGANLGSRDLPAV